MPPCAASADSTRNLQVIAPAKRQVTGAEGKDSDNHHQQDKPVVVACQRDPTDVHAEETGDDVNRQREDGDHRQGIEGAIALLQLAGANLLLSRLMRSIRPDRSLSTTLNSSVN